MSVYELCNAKVKEGGFALVFYQGIRVRVGAVVAERSRGLTIIA
jgi:hypothetical protein